MLLLPRCIHFNGTIHNKCLAGVLYMSVMPRPNPQCAIPCMVEFGIMFLCGSFTLSPSDKAQYEKYRRENTPVTTPSHNDNDAILRLHYVQAELGKLAGNVAHGTRGKIASNHLTKAITEIEIAMRHVIGQRKIDLANEPMDGEIIL